ncbi:hypothetical protein [Neolewinella antarctica]|uniref:Uncharacterized protein n=1 Tax=Neolewinella antarctica TaxID=442734 RepID=A0ABX0X9V2_9BACT|nr:hypothetical protein [Neolewinella antarctica]NJC26056.1 hypothetical protein [Neolewinella antarctica]
MRTLLIFPFVLFLFLPLWGQTTDNLYDCNTGSFAMSERFTAAYEGNDISLAKDIFDEWLELCGPREVTNRAFLLLSLATNDLLDVDQLSAQYYYMFQYYSRVNDVTSASNYEYNRPFYGFIPINKDFDRFTASAFSELNFEGNPEYNYLARIYSNDPSVTFNDLQGPEFNGTTLKVLYEDKVAETVNLLEGTYSAYAALWIPNDDVNQLGPHPEIGFTVGAQKQRLSYNLLIAFRFLNAKEPYLARRDKTDPFVETKHFFGGTLGVDVGYDLLRTEKTTVLANLGIGFDGFDNFTDEDDQDASSVGSFLVYGKLEWRHNLKNGHYLSLFTRYHQVNYGGGERVMLSASPVSVGITFGRSYNLKKDLQLRQLQYQATK